MSNNQVEETVDETATTQTPDTGRSDRVAELEREISELQKDRDKWKAMSRKNEERAKENADKAVQFDEIHPLYEKLTHRQLVAEVAKAKGIKNPAVLRGSTKEELESHADELLELIPEPLPGDVVSDVAGNIGDPVDPPEADPTPNDLIRAARRN